MGGSYTSSNQEGLACGPPEPCSMTVEGPSTVIDDQTDCVTRLGSHWWEGSFGYADHHYFTYTIDDTQTDSSATWEVHVAAAGIYQVEAYVPSSPDPLTQSVPYVIRHDGVEDEVTVDQSAQRGSWVLLGTYAFATGGDQWIQIVDNTGEPYVDEEGPRLVVDAVRLSVPDDCVDECDPGKRCAGSGYEECGDFDADGCLEWGDPMACDPDTHCEGAGECVADDTSDSNTGNDGATGDVGLPIAQDAAGLEGVVCSVSTLGTDRRAGPVGALLFLLLSGLLPARHRRRRLPRR